MHHDFWSKGTMKRMNDDQRQIVLGTLLGNGFICRSNSNSYLCIQHSRKYVDYFKSKAKDLESLSRTNPWYFRRNIIGWRSSCDTIWDYYRALCYQGEDKVVNENWLHPLRDIGLAVWYQDCGCLAGYRNRNACLRTQIFGEEGNKLIAKYFNEMGFDCKVNKSRKSWVILFSVASTEKLFKVIAHWIHPSLYYKLERNIDA